MLKNHNHDLMHQLSEMSDSLWRMDEYRKNSKGCERCMKIWNEIEKQFEKLSGKLVEEIGKHYEEKRFV